MSEPWVEPVVLSRKPWVIDMELAARVIEITSKIAAEAGYIEPLPEW